MLPIAFERPVRGTARGTSRRRRSGAVALAALGLGLAALAGCGRAPEEDAAGARAAARPPDVVIVLIDTLRADWLGAYDPARQTSPAIDALARESIVFEQASAPAPWTLPSVVSLFTSTFVGEHGVSRDGKLLAASIPTLAERMSALGYATLSFHRNPYAGELSGLDRGFDRCELVRGEVGGARLRPWLAAPPTRPLFLYVHDTQPHDPQRAPRELVPRFGEVSQDAIDEIASASDAYRKLTRADFVRKQPLGTEDNEAEQTAVLRRLDARRAEYEALYSAAVLDADRCVGEIVAELRRAGRFDGALVVLLADHGEEMGEHGGWQHDQSVYEELVHVPLVVRLPGGRHGGTRVKTPVSLIDVLPTIADVLERPELAKGARGTSLLQLVEGELDPDPAPRVISVRWNEKKHYRPWALARGERNVALRHGRWKAIWNADQDELELYDLEADPGEQNDLADAEPERARALADFARRAFAEQEAARETAGTLGLDAMGAEARDALEELGYVGDDGDEH